jgi:O-antigen/teichoic acid export membrane protein
MSSFASQTLVTFGARIAYAALYLLLRFGIALYLTVEQQGDFFAFSQLFIALALIESAGLKQAAVYFMQREPGEAKTILSSTLWFSIVQAPIVVALAWGILAIIPAAGWLHLDLKILIAVVVTSCISNYFQNGQFLLLSIRRSGVYNALNLATVLIQILLFVLFAAIMSSKLWAAVLSYGISLLLGSLITTGYFLKHRLLTWTMFDPTFKRRLRYGLAIIVSMIIAYVNYRLDFFMVRHYVHEYGAGLYSMAVMMAETVWFFPDAAALILFPEVSSAGFADARRLGALASRHILFIAGLTMVPIGLVALLFIKTLGTAYAGSFLPFCILLPGVVLFSNCKVVSVLMSGAGKLLEINVSAALVMVLNISGMVLLVPRWGMPGAALATTIGYGFGTVYLLIRYARASGTRFSELVIMRQDDFSWYRERGRGLLLLMRGGKTADQQAQGRDSAL